MSHVIETPRLRLRPHEVKDIGQYAPLWRDPPEPNNPAAFSLDAEDAWYRLLRFVGHWSHFGYGLFVVEDRAKDRIIGEAGFAHFHRGIDPRFDDSPEGAWRILPDYRGQKIAQEAMLAAAEWFDRNAAAARTVCIIDPANAASIKVARRLGFAQFAQRIYKGGEVILFERITGPSPLPAAAGAP